MNESLADVMGRIEQKWQASFEPLQVDDRTYQVLAIGDMQAHINKMLATKSIHDPLLDLPLWAKIWPGSIVLGRFLRNFSPQGKTMLELGCGMGALSLVASVYGFAAITATDVNGDALDFARAHVLKNELQHLIDVKFLDVTGRTGGKWDIIAASELLYLDSLHRPLLKFLVRHLNQDGKAFFCTDIARLKPHFAKLAAKSFKVTEGKIGVKAGVEDGEVERRAYSILILERP